MNNTNRQGAWDAEFVESFSYELGLVFRPGVLGVSLGFGGFT
jgi:hypothetical protein